MPRLGTTAAEAALVGLFVLHHHDLDAIAALVALNVNSEPWKVLPVLRAFSARVAVKHALTLWVEHRRLPKQVSHRWILDGEQFPLGSWIRRGRWFHRTECPPVTYAWPVHGAYLAGDCALLWRLGHGPGPLRFHIAVSCRSRPTDLLHDGRHWRFLENADRTDTNPIALRDCYPSRWRTADGYTWRVDAVKPSRNGRLVVTLGKSMHAEDLATPSASP